MKRPGFAKPGFKGTWPDASPGFDGFLASDRVRRSRQITGRGTFLKHLLIPEIPETMIYSMLATRGTPLNIPTYIQVLPMLQSTKQRKAIILKS